MSTPLRMTLVYFIALVLPFLIDPDMDTQDTTEMDRNAIERAIKEFIDAYNVGDVGRLMAVYDEDFIDMSEGVRTIRGSEALSFTESKLQRTFSDFAGNLRVSTDQITIAGNYAFTRGTYEVTLKPKDGSENIFIHRRFLEVWYKQEGDRWKVITAMDNTEVSDGAR